MILLNRFTYSFSSVNSVMPSLCYVLNGCLFSLLTFFLLLRVPCLYNALNLWLILFLGVMPLFLSLFFSRIESSFNSFFASLLPPGAPLWIAPFVGLAETISYLVRPMVLLIRPFLNITIGSLGGLSLGGGAVSYWPLIGVLVFLFLYEVFVALVHWYIVVNIINFSVDH